MEKTRLRGIVQEISDLVTNLDWDIRYNSVQDRPNGKRGRGRPSLKEAEDNYGNQEMANV